MNANVLALIKNEGKTEEQRQEQVLTCAYIDGYLDGINELEKYITKLYKGKNQDASILYKLTRDLYKSSCNKYNQLCNELNNI